MVSEPSGPAKRLTIPNCHLLIGGIYNAEDLTPEAEHSLLHRLAVTLGGGTLSLHVSAQCVHDTSFLTHLTSLQQLDDSVAVDLT